MNGGGGDTGRYDSSPEMCLIQYDEFYLNPLGFKNTCNNSYFNLRLFRERTLHFNTAMFLFWKQITGGQFTNFPKNHLRHAWLYVNIYIHKSEHQ